MAFNLFGKQQKNDSQGPFVDRIYINTARKLDALLEQARLHPDMVFITWFHDTTAILRSFFSKNGVPEDRVVESRCVHLSILEHKTPVFAEHYPMHSREIDLVHNWTHVSPVVYSAMDEPLFRHFGSEKMIPLIKLLGMKEHESIEHSLVSKSIARGQEKIAAQVNAEQLANSQAEWLEKNLK